MGKIFGWKLNSNEGVYSNYPHIFSVWHFVALAVIIGSITTLAIVSKRKDKKWHDRMFFVIALIFLGLEILRMTYRTITYCCYETYYPEKGNIYNWAEIISFALCYLPFVIKDYINKRKQIKIVNSEQSSEDWQSQEKTKENSLNEEKIVNSTRNKTGKDAKQKALTKDI